MRRWFSVIFCGIVASLIWLILDASLHAYFGAMAGVIGAINGYALAPLILTASVAACWPLGRGRWPAFLGLLHFWSFPPLWIAVVVSVLIISAIDWLPDPPEENVSRGFEVWAENAADDLSFNAELVWWSIRKSWPSLIALFIPAVVIGFTGVRADADRDGARMSERDDKQRSEFEELRDWFQDDREIGRPADDRFGEHSATAARIARRLIQDGERPTIAVVGAPGSGKSTIRALVEYELRDRSSIEIIGVSLWPYDSPEAAVRGVLRSMIDGLGKHVNVLGLTGLPTQYVNAIEGAGGVWKTLAALLRRDAGPKETVERIGEVAASAGVTLILWIEDMERFTGADRLQPEQGRIREAERLGPILSLLHILDQCKSISVVVADTSLHSRLDVEKIARFVESTPRLAPEGVWKEFTLLRSECLSQDLADPATAESRNALAPSTHLNPLRAFIRDETRPSITDAIPILLETPRELKMALRITWETWDHLSGEIDIDSVLVASTLRVARPDVFTLIDQNIDAFRHGLKGWGLANQKGERRDHEASEKLETLLKERESPRSAGAVKAAISFVFPPALNDLDRSSHYVQRPQGLGVKKHADNWKRYLTLPEKEDDSSDQATLRAIDAWKCGQHGDLIERILSPAKAEQVGTFVNRFTKAELCDLLHHVAIALRDSLVTEWEGPFSPTGLYRIWELMSIKRPPSDRLVTTLKGLIRELTCHHLALSHSIYYYFAASHRSLGSLLDPTGHDEVRAERIDALRDLFRREDPAQILASIRDAPPQVVYWACYEPDRVNHCDGFLGIPFEEWSPVAERLLDVAEYDPRRGLPLIVPFVLQWRPVIGDDPETGGPVHDDVPEFDERAARALFGDFDRLLRLLAQRNEFTDLDERIVRQLTAAREGVRRVIERP